MKKKKNVLFRSEGSKPKKTLIFLKIFYKKYMKLNTKITIVHFIKKKKKKLGTYFKLDF